MVERIAGPPNDIGQPIFFIAKYSCDSGYVLIGKHNKTCNLIEADDVSGIRRKRQIETNFYDEKDTDLQLNIWLGRKPYCLRIEGENDVIFV